MDDEQLQKLIGAGIVYVSIHPRSESEILLYLTKRVHKLHIPEIGISLTVERLRQLGYVNDQAYARMFVESRMRSRPKGENLIRRELMKKGVSEEDAEPVLREKFHGEDTRSEYNLAKRLVMKKWEHWKQLPRLDQKKKVFGLLARRGFSQTVIHTIIDEYTRNNYNTVSMEGGEDAETPSV